MKKILELLEHNSRLSPDQIATMLEMDTEEVKQKIKEWEENKIILSYHTLINWEKAGEEKVSAFIEVKITPQRDIGFDAIAERICHFPEVKTVRLMSGDYDLAIIIEGRTMKEAARFVATKLATIENVQSTATHFVLKTFKQDGVIFEDGEKSKRLVVSP